MGHGCIFLAVSVSLRRESLQFRFFFFCFEVAPFSDILLLPLLLLLLLFMHAYMHT